MHELIYDYKTGRSLQQHCSTVALEHYLLSVYSKDKIQQFFKHWIYGDSFPEITVAYFYDTKKSGQHVFQIARYVGYTTYSKDYNKPYSQNSDNKSHFTSFLFFLFVSVIFQKKNKNEQ